MDIFCLLSKGEERILRICRALSVILLLLLLIALAFPIVTVASDEVELTWNPNVEVDLAGYKIYYKPFKQAEYDYTTPVWTGIGIETECVVEVPGDGEFVARAFDLAGNHSIDSDIVVHDSPPRKVQNLIKRSMRQVQRAKVQLEKAIDCLDKVIEEL